MRSEEWLDLNKFQYEKISRTIAIIVSVFYFPSHQKLNAQAQSLIGKDLALRKVDSTNLYINIQQQYSDFSGTMSLNQSSAGIKLKKPQ